MQEPENLRLGIYAGASSDDMLAVLKHLLLFTTGPSTAVNPVLGPTLVATRPAAAL